MKIVYLPCDENGPVRRLAAILKADRDLVMKTMTTNTIRAGPNGHECMHLLMRVIKTGENVHYKINIK